MSATAVLASDEGALETVSRQFITISKHISDNLQQPLKAELAADFDLDRITESIAI